MPGILMEWHKGVKEMTMTQRALLAAVIVLIDLVAFFIPLTALVVAYVILLNPPWFKAFMQRLDA